MVGIERGELGAVLLGLVELDLFDLECVADHLMQRPFDPDAPCGGSMVELEACDLHRFDQVPRALCLPRHGRARSGHPRSRAADPVSAMGAGRINLLTIGSLHSFAESRMELEKLNRVDGRD